MPGLDPGIHHFRKSSFEKMDHRVKPGDDDINRYDGSLWSCAAARRR
jgi:hypothetical protein